MERRRYRFRDGRSGSNGGLEALLDCPDEKGLEDDNAADTTGPDPRRVVHDRVPGMPYLWPSPYCAMEIDGQIFVIQGDIAPFTLVPSKKDKGKGKSRMPRKRRARTDRGAESPTGLETDEEEIRGTEDGRNTDTDTDPDPDTDTETNRTDNQERSGEEEEEDSDTEDEQDSGPQDQEKTISESGESTYFEPRRRRQRYAIQHTSSVSHTDTDEDQASEVASPRSEQRGVRQRISKKRKLDGEAASSVCETPSDRNSPARATRHRSDRRRLETTTWLPQHDVVESSDPVNATQISRRRTDRRGLTTTTRQRQRAAT